ncbi:MAG: aldo/keto reductase [bacterium]
MQYIQMGASGLTVSRLAFGTMSFGDQADEKTSAELYATCRDAGVTVFDTADVYTQGRSEEILGRLIAGHRDEVIVASKAYFPTGPGTNDRGASRYHLRRAVEASLKRMNIDHIDVYYVHRFDDKTPIEETFRALDDLVSDGKIGYVGVSNFSAWQTQQAVDLCKHRGWTAPSVIQPMYNLVKRQAEVELLPMAAANGVGVMAYSPLGGGLLTGKYGPGQKPASGRLVENAMYSLRYGDQDNYRVASEFTALAQEFGVHPVALAVRWVADHPAVTAPLLGARSVSQLSPALQALDIDLPDDWYRRIAALSTAPPTATDRSEEGTNLHYGVR